MEKNLEYSDLLRLIEDRSAAFCAAVASAPGLDVQVPTCPDWTLYDLVQHLGEGRRRWAATVASGPDATARSAARSEPVAPREREALLAWMAASTQELLDELREAAPDRACFTGWGASQTPHTCGGVARHQLQEIAVHTYDAQATVGAPEPLPVEIALDGVEEFLFTCNATTSPWPHKPNAIDYHTTEGRSWRLTVDGDGARAARIAGDDPEAGGVSVRCTASDTVLFMYGRVSMDGLEVDGDPELLDQLIEWVPEE
ncbi:maleylpyruvate isomerase family mycothiol-dependent enzyme [Kitasatospora sp. NPDC059571]|uniref:maleylpyruvate isomerase family mycothiol-dependent enzyme n=1 Tax=Kitasatospora sp. NPDC059571 TaxID=3346871 RepID=UPI00367E5864